MIIQMAVDALAEVLLVLPEWCGGPRCSAAEKPLTVPVTVLSLRQLETCSQRPIQSFKPHKYFTMGQSRMYIQIWKLTITRIYVLPQCCHLLLRFQYSSTCPGVCQHYPPNPSFPTIREPLSSINISICIKTNHGFLQSVSIPHIYLPSSWIQSPSLFA
jgi:hypothetical protein